MIDSIKCSYEHNGVNVTLEVKEDWKSNGAIVSNFAELVIKVIEDGNFNPDTIIESLKLHFDYEKEDSDD